ncbi:MAG: hypothetical protein GX970_03875 [Phyllobacteriaceae bacterium]|nr:hypothetical protein [Phyllobacteriaceae bacterium]
MDLSRKSAVWAIVMLIAASSGTASALTPLPQPEAFAGIKPGDPTPFIGHWMMTLPTMEMGTPDADYATCDRPVRIEGANEDHIFYFGPDQAGVDPAIQLTPRENGTYWEPIASALGRRGHVLSL